MVGGHHNTKNYIKVSQHQEGQEPLLLYSSAMSQLMRPSLCPHELVGFVGKSDAAQSSEDQGLG